MDAPAPIAIIGAGQAGATLTITLRQQGCPDPITLFGAEVHAPYERPPLSKELLSGAMQPAQLQVQAVAQYDAQDIHLHLGAPVQRIVPDEHRLVCADGSSHKYSRLVLATGGTPRVLPTLQPDGSNVLVFRTLDDAQALAARVVSGHRLVIVGAGLIGTELASAFCASGAHITVVDPAARPMANALVPELGAAVEQLLTERGVTFRWGDTVVRQGDAVQPLLLRTRDGDILQADTVVVCAGTVPEIALAQAAGLATRSGILVDAAGETSHPDIYAIGDCAEFLHPLYGRHLRLEQCQHAVGQATALAARLCGGTYAYDAVPWAWTEVTGRRLALIGPYGRDDTVLWAGPPGEPGSVAVTGRGSEATGAQGFITPRTASRIRQALKARKTLDEVAALCEPATTTA